MKTLRDEKMKEHGKTIRRELRNEGRNLENCGTQNLELRTSDLELDL